MVSWAAVTYRKYIQLLVMSIEYETLNNESYKMYEKLAYLF